MEKIKKIVYIITLTIIPIFLGFKIDDCKALSCLYTEKGTSTKITITVDESKGEITEIDAQGFQLNISKSDFVSDGAYACPYQLYKSTSNGSTTYSFNDGGITGPQQFLRLTDPTTMDYIVPETNNNENGEGTQTNNPTRNNLNSGLSNNGNIDNCQALFGERTQKFLKSVFNMIKYLGPTLTGVFTIIDLIKAAASGEADEMKKVYKKFSKRIISAILLFFIPTLIDIIFQAVDLTSPNSCLNW